MSDPYRTAAALKLKAAQMEAPVVWCLKVVPDSSPNADGVWRKFVIEASDRRPEERRVTMWEQYNKLVAKAYPGHHCVAVQSDLRFADKPGNWWPDSKGN